MPPGVSQFPHSAMGSYCNGGLANMGDLPAYTDGMRGGTAAAATGWYSANPDPRYSSSERGQERGAEGRRNPWGRVAGTPFWGARGASWDATANGWRVPGPGWGRAVGVLEPSGGPVGVAVASV